jgi:flagellar protein FlgJ
MNLSQLPITLLTPPAANAAGSKQSKTAAAAKDFEALLIGEMLKSVREESDEGWLGGGSDSGSETAFGMAENQFAKAISDSGGLGLAKTIQRAVEKESASHNTPGIASSANLIPGK